jgi:hypothetical protein
MIRLAAPAASMKGDSDPLEDFVERDRIQTIFRINR